MKPNEFKLTIKFIKQITRCLLGKHDWQIMYQGIEGTSRDCRCCGKTQEDGVRRHGLARGKKGCD